MPPPPFAAILWDIDGTLADSEPVHDLSFKLAAKDLGLTLPENFHEILLGKAEDTTHAWMQRHVGLTLSLEDWQDRRIAAYLDNLDRVRPMPAALDLWHRVAATGGKQATVSNSDRLVVQANLGVLGLARPGAVSLSRNDVIEGKPHPELYLRAAALLGADPARCAVVEDSDTGAQAGLESGMQVFIFGRNGDLPTGARPFTELAAMYG